MHGCFAATQLCMPISRSMPTSSRPKNRRAGPWCPAGQHESGSWKPAPHLKHVLHGRRWRGSKARSRAEKRGVTEDGSRCPSLAWPTHQVVPCARSRVARQPNALIQVLHHRLPAGVDVKRGAPAVCHLRGTTRDWWMDGGEGTCSWWQGCVRIGSGMATGNSDACARVRAGAPRSQGPRANLGAPGPRVANALQAKQPSRPISASQSVAAWTTAQREGG